MTSSERVPGRLPGWADVALFLLILAGAVFLRARHLDAPVGHGFKGANAGLYYGQFEKHYLRLGMWDCKFGLVAQSWPGTTEGLIRDLRHPVLPSWMFHGAVLATGDVEFGLRLIPFLAACLGVLLLWFLARMCLSPGEALVATRVCRSHADGRVLRPDGRGGSLPPPDGLRGRDRRAPLPTHPKAGVDSACALLSRDAARLGLLLVRTGHVAHGAPEQGRQTAAVEAALDAAPGRARVRALLRARRLGVGRNRQPAGRPEGGGGHGLAEQLHAR